MMTVIRTNAFTMALALALAAGAATAHAAQTGQTNVVVILADDLGYADVGFNGCRDIPTPNIDSLAGNGVRCSNGYVTHPFCSPTRAGLMISCHSSLATRHFSSARKSWLDP